MHRRVNPLASALMRVLAFLSLSLLLTACVAGPPPRTGPAPFGVPAGAPAAQGALAQACVNLVGCTLIAVDAATAQPIPGLEPVDVGIYAIHGLSPDGRMLATIAYPHNDNLYGNTVDGALLITDLAAWKTVDTALTFDNLMLPPVFSPDNRRLYLVRPVSGYPMGHKLIAVDVAARHIAGETALPFSPRRLAVTPDGAALHLYGTDQNSLFSITTNPAAYVARINTADLSLAWAQTLDGVRDGHYAPDGSTDPHAGVWWEAASLFTPDASTLYIAHADEPRLTTVEFRARAPAVATASIAPRRTWGEWLRSLVVRTAHAKILNGSTRMATLSPDGARLYIGGVDRNTTDDSYREEPVGVQVIDLPGGRAVPPGPPAFVPYPDAGGGRLFLVNWRYTAEEPYTEEWTEVVDAATLEQTAILEGWTVRPARRLDGQPVLLGQRTLPSSLPELALFDPTTLTPQVVDEGPAEAYGFWVLPQ